MEKIIHNILYYLITLQFYFYRAFSYNSTQGISKDFRYEDDDTQLNVGDTWTEDDRIDEFSKLSESQSNDKSQFQFASSGID
jgi:hypothetical protein